MKVGTGNGAFPIALAKFDFNKCKDTKPTRLEEDTYNQFHLNELENTPFYLYTGYDTITEIPKLTKDGKIEFRKTGKIGELPGDIVQENPNQSKDIFWIAYASSSEHHKQVRILVYGDTHLFIFAPQCDRWGRLPESEMKGKLSNEGRLKQIFKSMQIGPQYTFEMKAFLEVRLVGCVERRKLAAGIDSLAVFQWLSQGTFRPIFSCGAGREKNMPKEIQTHLPYLDVNKTPLSIHIPMNSKKIQTPKKEYRYASLLREYFEALLDPEKSANLTHRYQDLHYLLLSPAQLEAAASLLTMDLGYMPDFYSAGSHDYIDVRARKIKNPPNLQTPNFAKIVFGVLNDRCANGYTPNDIIELQCKNYEEVDSPDRDNVILFEPQTSPSIGKVGAKIALDEVIGIMDKLNPDKTFLLQQWLAKQKQTLKESLAGKPLVSSY
jgi:hypothetical protein